MRRTSLGVVPLLHLVACAIFALVASVQNHLAQCRPFLFSLLCGRKSFQNHPAQSARFRRHRFAFELRRHIERFRLQMSMHVCPAI